tara:strand:+ start:918 stop:1112 length:195 start_codon:yes stop_codon:yes gene_type:complete
MEAIASFSIIVLLLIGIVWLIPFVIILFSNKTSGIEKLGWLLAVSFVTWFAWIFYFLFAPVIKK